MEESEKSTNERSSLWNHQYATGHWEFLKSQIEEARFNTLTDSIVEYATDSYMLEIGCGEGLLLNRMKSVHEYYLGIDISEFAINNAKHLNDGRTKFEVADMESFIPPFNFDLIIFNESLYYSKEPLALIRRYMKCLKKDAVIITSIFEDPYNLELVNQIRTVFRSIKQKRTVNSRGVWHCDVFC